MKNNGHDVDAVFMLRALELAAYGRGSVSPNPMVGCVIVHEGRMIGEGWHKGYGGPHAEVNAVNSTIDKELLKESTVYVTLEPCSHFGKTPPCTDLLIESGVKTVVVAMQDPNPLVAGSGIRKLAAANIAVQVGVMEEKARELNKRFVTWIEEQRPYVILKWAETSDGFMAREDLDSKWISEALSRQLVHRWRTEEDAVLVGTRTAAHDNPQLNVRDWTGRDPVRIVIDRTLKLDPALHLFDGRQKTICYNTIKSEDRPNINFVRLDDKDFLPGLMRDLHGQGIQSLIVEGGPGTLRGFIDAGYWDEARTFISTRKFGQGIAAPTIRGKLIAQQSMETDELRILEPHRDGKNKHR